jgi:nitroreductase
VDVEQLLTTTRSARRALDLDAPVDRDDIRECLRIGLQAANGSNEQPWRWLVVADADRRARVALLYQDVYRDMTSGGPTNGAEGFPDDLRRLLESTQWLADHLYQVPLLVIPCYQPYLPSFGDDDSFGIASAYGSIFPAVWNFQLALHTRGYGTCITTLHLRRQAEIRELLGIPDTYVQGCLLPVARLKPGRTFRPATRRPVDEVVAVDDWTGPPL